MILDLATFAGAVGDGKRVMGVDLGSKTIGVAVSDRTWMVATPVETIRRTKFSKDIDVFLALVAERKAHGLVIGLPINMDGTEGPRVQSTRAFADNVAKHTDMPITFWDERLSTAAVTRTLLEADSSRKRRGEVVDKMAAAYILQGALDRLSVLKTK